MSRAVTSGSVTVGLVLGLVFLASHRVAACSCARPPSPQESLARADAVFHGRLVAVRNVESLGYEAMFSVLEIWKGPVASRIKVVTSIHRLICQGEEHSVLFGVDDEFIVYAFEESGELLAGISGELFLHPCARTSRFDPLEAEELGESLWSREKDGVPFVRGDVNFDGKTDITDPITILPFSFLGGVVLFCEDAADANDDGVIDITDPIYLLGFLFLGAEPIPPPTVRPGLDATVDGLGCAGPPG